jgi:hypothetical protein
MQSVHEALSLEDLRRRRARRLERTRSERPFNPLVAEERDLVIRSRQTASDSEDRGKTTSHRPETSPSRRFLDRVDDVHQTVKALR